jgi:lysophospholipase L1-like esterase
MRASLLRLCVLIALGSLTLPAVAQSTYYLALGDSLAIGLQPSQNGDVPTNQGYADDLYLAFRQHIPGLRLVKLGCSGETTATMLEGGVCSYFAGGGSQLAQALAFIETHHVSLITIDIGANDIDHCVTLAGIDASCVQAAITSVGTNLPEILAKLRAAAGSIPIVAMNYYDPFLAAWTLGTEGQVLAENTVQSTDCFNQLLGGIYERFSVPVANVAGTFQTNNFTILPFIDLPVNVFITLTWTWMGAPAPLGPDVHPNAIGYAAIAGSFAETIALGKNRI